MLPHVVEFRSQFSTGNCSQLFTSTVHHKRQNYCLHLSLLCFGSQLLSKQNHISQISLELEKYNFKINTPVYQTPSIEVLYHRKISTVFLVWHEGWCVRCTGLGAERPCWGALGYSSLLYSQLPINQQECSSLCEALEEISMPLMTNNLCIALAEGADICGALKVPLEA